MALAPSRLIALPAAAMRDAAATDAGLMRAAMEQMARHWRGMLDQVVDLKTRDATQRAARFLLHRLPAQRGAVEVKLALDAPPTAIVTDCNTHGDGAAMALAQMGRLTGENAVSLVVYDGLPQDSIVDIDVAAVIQSTRQGVGKQIADMVLQLINGSEISQLQVLWQPEFFPGETA